MRFALLALFVFALQLASGNNPYRSYMLVKSLFYRPQLKTAIIPAKQTATTTCVIPRYQIPKGNVFCRMEDKLTKATGVWIKVGVK